MHRSLQIVQAIQAAIEAETDLAAAVFAHRTLSLSQADQELPAVIVDSGVDAAFNDWDVLVPTDVNSKLEVRCTAFTKNASQEDVAVELARLRSVIHRAVLGGDRSFGLSFVYDTVYAGAEAPDMDAGTESAIGSQTSVFVVHYTMNLTDPE